jgi:lipooligosaccharide transport system permease protein
VLYGSIFALVVALFGLVQGLGALLLVPIVVATAFLFAGLGLCFTSLVKVIDMYSFYYTLWLTPLFLFSGIFFPVSGFPEWGRIAAWLTPLYHCVRLAQGAVHGTLGAGHLVDVAWILLVGMTANVIAIRRLRRGLSA